MNLAFTYDDHHSAGSVWKKRKLKESMSAIFERPNITIAPHCTTEIRTHVERALENEGWALKVKVIHRLGLTIFARKDDLAFQLQTGNISRAQYDLLKLQYLFQQELINAAALALPTKNAAKKIGSNVANAERVISELKVFDRVITVPILVIAFE